MKHGEDSKKKIEIVPYSGYKISKIKINEKEIEINANDEGIVVIDKLENIKENKNITVEFEKIKSKVIIKYLGKETNQEISEEQIKEGEVGEEYVAIPKDIKDYVLVEPIPQNAKGQFEEEAIIVKYYYAKEEVKKPDDTDKKDEENTSRFTKDGTYSVDVALWNATSDKESMAASAINSKAKIIVKDGKATMYLSTKEMSFGSIKASLQEFYIGSEQEDYKNHGATIIEKDAQGNPTLWAFELPHENEYINVMMNPHVAMMGNMDLAARLKIDYTTLTYVSDKTELEPNTKKDDQQENTNKDQTANKENQINENQSVKTGDQTSIQLFMTLFIISITMIGFILRKKHEA